MSLPLFRRSFLGSLLGLAATPLAGRAAPAGPPRFTADGQPIPLETRSGRMYGVTAIWRRWHKASIPACKLCPPGTCCAIGDSCLVMVGKVVPRTETARFDASDTVRVEV